MSGWNYRVLHRVLQGFGSTEHAYAVYEVYYNKADAPNSCSVDPQAPHGETPEELRADLERYVKALDKPVLEYEDFGATKDPA